MTNSESVSRRRSLFIWGLFCTVTGVIFLAYVFTSLAAGRGELVMPLDDVYIHFQYARQLAAGQPYIYNPGLPASSGATSFLYPYLLAIGYVLGFQALNLGLWAMLIGALSLLGSMQLIYLLVKAYLAPDWIAVFIALVFGLTGSVSWHFMSGMETSLAVFFMLLTLYTVIEQSLEGTVIAATLLALIRPEGGILAVLAVIVLYFVRRRITPMPWQSRVGLLLIPILALGVQPLVNLLFTGSTVASGNAAKSLFGIVPPYPDVILSRILDNFTRMWVEFASSASPREGLYVAYPIPLLAIVGLVSLLRSRGRRLIGLLIIVWLLAGTMAIATLDTAFWHFKRYQMPFMAPLFPLAGWGGAMLWQSGTRRYVHRLVGLIVASVTVVLTLWTGTEFLHHFVLNASYIYLQPLQMVRWLEANTPPDSVVAVHDTGLIRYLGGRTTLDMVGLTTPGAAAYWRNGPGAVAEFLMQEHPDYIASYGHGHGLGLGMLADTSLYGEPLASFPVVLDNRYNVSLAGDFQGIYEPNLEAIGKRLPSQPSIVENYLGENVIRIGGLDVANIEQEMHANYQWRNADRLPGFPTEVRELNYANCIDADCRIVDGGRLMNGEESFDLTLFADSGQAAPILLVTRVHPANAGTIDVYANGNYVATRWIPELPGKWLEIPTLIPREDFSNPLHIRIIPHVPGGSYAPYNHAAYFFDGQTAPASEAQLTTFQNGAIVLSAAEISYDQDAAQVSVNLNWYTPGNAQGDYIVFVHLYNEANEIVAQTDERPGDGTLPPGNWLPGAIHDTIEVDVNDVPPGCYRVAIGLYDPVTLERLAPSTGGDADNRLFIGEVDIHE